MNIAALVILYNPHDDVVRNISTYLPFVQQLYIADNSIKDQSTLLKNILTASKVLYIYDGENKGIALRLNQVCTMAKQEGYSWLLTMDQDSAFTEQSIQQYFSCCQEYQPKNLVAMFGVRYVGTETGTSSCNAIQTRQLITSGSIVNLSLFSTIGNFDEALFIDQVDLEYCYRSIEKGFKIIQFDNIELQHQLGKIATHKSLKSLKQTERSLHSSIRIYYMTRNFLYVQSKYKRTFKAEVTSSRKDLLTRIKNNILYGNEGLSVLKYIILGIKDYRRNKMGKL